MLLRISDDSAYWDVNPGNLGEINQVFYFNCKIYTLRKRLIFSVNVFMINRADYDAYYLATFEGQRPATAPGINAGSMLYLASIIFES